MAGVLNTVARVPLAAEVDELDHWVSIALPGERCIYATGPELPRGAPAVSRARILAESGLVTLTTQAIVGGRNFIAVRCAIDPNKPVVDRHVPPQEDALAEKVLARLRRAANFSQLCPTNAELARDCGLKDADAASYRIKKLIRERKIRVEDQGPNRRRIVTIVATGRRTVPGAL